MVTPFPGTFVLASLASIEAGVPVNPYGRPITVRNVADSARRICRGHIEVLVLLEQDAVHRRGPYAEMPGTAVELFLEGIRQPLSSWVAVDASRRNISQQASYETLTFAANRYLANNPPPAEAPKRRRWFRR